MNRNSLWGRRYRGHLSLYIEVGKNRPWCPSRASSYPVDAVLRFPMMQYREMVNE